MKHLLLFMLSVVLLSCSKNDDATGVTTKTKEYSETVYYNAPSRLVPRLGFARGRAFYYYSYVNPYSIYVGREMRTMNIKEGSVMIDLIDHRSGKVI